MLHQWIWTGPDEQTVVVRGESRDPFAVRVYPVITASRAGIMVGLYYRDGKVFGHWHSKPITDLPVAWRAARLLLPQLLTFRAEGPDGPDTLTNLVRAVAGELDYRYLPQLADDLGLDAVTKLEAEIAQANQAWPRIRGLRAMWDLLPDTVQDQAASSLHEALLTSCQLPDDQNLLESLERALQRHRTTTGQLRREDRLIAAGLSLADSLRQLLLDIGISALYDTITEGEGGVLRSFDMANLDRLIMEELIGTRGGGDRVLLVAPALFDIGERARFTLNGRTVEKGRHPVVILGNHAWELVSVSWDRVVDQFQLTLRPTGSSFRIKGVKRLTVQELRDQIGDDNGPLQPGHPASWCTVLGPETASLVGNLTE